jgi:hypothetical protein
MLTQASQQAPTPRKKPQWTQAMRDAQAKRLRDRWKAGDFGPKKKKA